MIDAECDCCDGSMRIGAAIVFGLLGMAEAIRETYLCPHCGGWEGCHTRQPYRTPCQCWNDE